MLFYCALISNGEIKINMFSSFPVLVVTLNTSWPYALISIQISTLSGTTSRSPTLKLECPIVSLLSTSPSQQVCIIVVCAHCCTRKQKQRSTRWGGKGQEMKSSITKTISAMMAVSIFLWHGHFSSLMTGIPATLLIVILTLTATCRTTFQPLLEIQGGPNSARSAFYAIPWLGI